MTKTQKPSAPRHERPLLLCRVSWLIHYDGRPDDLPISNHKFVLRGKAPHEIMNFLPVPGGIMQAYVQVKDSGDIHIERLGAGRKALEIDGVTVVWCAQHPDRSGMVVVGWYNNATVFREPQPAADERQIGEKPVQIRLQANAADCVLLSPEQRTFFVQPRGAKVRAFGKADVSYISERNTRLATAVRQYVAKETQFRPTNIDTRVDQNSFFGQTDPEQNAKVERFAEEFVVKHFDGWTAKGVQDEYRGWDIEFSRGKKRMRVEVKGRSAPSPAFVRLTYNEHKMFIRATWDKSFSEEYRLAIVHNCLTSSPTLRLYRYKHSPSTGWICELTGERLNTEPAGIFATPTAEAAN